MKTLRYLLIVIAMAGFLSAHAQGLAQQPQAQMQSTSVMQGTGSTLPQAAVTGVHTTADQTPRSARTPSGPRKERPGDWTDPYPDPLSDVMWPMMALACAYALARAFLKYLLYRKKQ